MFVLFGLLFLDRLLELFHLLAQLHKRLLHGIGSLGAFVGCPVVGFLLYVFLIPAPILGNVHGMCDTMLLAEVAVFLGAGFLGNKASRLGTRSLVSLGLLLCKAFSLDCALDPSWVHIRLTASRDKRSKYMSTGVIPSL